MSGGQTSDVDFDLTAPGGATLRLMPERAAWCPTGGTLFVADLHLGKAATFRARGLPVPQGTTTETLERLTAALRRSGAHELVVLGDLLHAREAHAAPTLDALRRWRDAHPDLRCQLVGGNHDRHAGPLAADLGFETLPGAFQRGPWLGVHDPDEAEAALAAQAPQAPHKAHEALASETSCASDISHLLKPVQAAQLVLAGHVHPVVTLGGRVDRLRLPCFWWRDRVLTLPAFGAFTGGWQVGGSGRADRIYVVGERVMPWSP
jgi:DNA ligase-associated metallophosphoesterase